MYIRPIIQLAQQSKCPFSLGENVVSLCIMSCFRYNYYDGATCSVSYTSNSSTKWPLYGQLVQGDNAAPVSNLRHDCRDFLYLHLRYCAASHSGIELVLKLMRTPVNYDESSTATIKRGIEIMRPVMNNVESRTALKRHSRRLVKYLIPTFCKIAERMLNSFAPV